MLKKYSNIICATVMKHLVGNFAAITKTFQFKFILITNELVKYKCGCIANGGLSVISWKDFPHTKSCNSHFCFVYVCGFLFGNRQRNNNIFWIFWVAIKICSQKNTSNHNKAFKERKKRNMIFVSINVVIPTLFGYEPSAAVLFPEKKKTHGIYSSKVKMSQKFFFLRQNWNKIEY